MGCFSNRKLFSFILSPSSPFLVYFWFEPRLQNSADAPSIPGPARRFAPARPSTAAARPLSLTGGPTRHPRPRVGDRPGAGTRPQAGHARASGRRHACLGGCPAYLKVANAEPRRLRPRTLAPQPRSAAAAAPLRHRLPTDVETFRRTARR
jgi:hypothetical protein